MTADGVESIESDGLRKPRRLSPAKVESLCFVGIVLACVALIVFTVIDVEDVGDDNTAHAFDIAILVCIAAAAAFTHRAFRLQQETQAAMAVAMAETARLRAARTANAAKSRYLANVSHEIRSPLNAIYGYAQLVERDDGVSVREAAKVIRRCAEHMTSLVEGLLDVSQIEHGVLRVRSEEVRFAAFLDQIVSMIRPGATAKGLTFVYEPPARLPGTVRMDPNRLRQVLLNLLSNAIKFTDRGSVTLRVGYSGQIARFEIIDTGPGIATDELESVFDPFERGCDEDKSARPGAGLGLSISRAIVEILGGRMEVESEVGKGSCFRITMMVGEVAGALEQDTAPLRLSGYDGRTRSLLIVDDEAEQRAVMERLLTVLGFKVTAAANGETALALARDHSFDLALLDISMPGLSGWETAFQLRDVLGKDLRILMLSANSQEFHRPEFHTPVHDHFLVKPVDFAALTEAIGGLLQLNWKVEDPGEPAAPIAAGAAAPVSGKAAEHVERLRELLRIGYVRGIEAEIRELAASDEAAGPLAARLFDCLDRYDLATMQNLLAAEAA